MIDLENIAPDETLMLIASELVETGMSDDDAWDFIEQAKFIREGETKTITQLHRSVTFKRENGVLSIVDLYGNIETT